MKMSVMRYDGLQGQPFWMQNEQLANPSQYCLKTTARVESDRRKVHRSLHGLNEDPLGPSRIMQMDDSAFNNDSVKDEVSGKRRKASSDGITRRKLLRISGLDEDGRDMASSSSFDDDESRSSDDDSGVVGGVDGHHYGANRMAILGDLHQQSGVGGSDLTNNCDNDDVEMESANAMELNKDYNAVDEDDATSNADERCVDGVEGRNNGDELNLDEEYNNFDEEFEHDGRSVRTGKDLNCDEDSNSFHEKNNSIGKEDSVETETTNVATGKRTSVLNTLSRLNQTALETKLANSSATALKISSNSGSRRNKRKNFKPRNIVYQYDMCEEGDNELIDDYQLALSNWELSHQKNSSRDSPGAHEVADAEETSLGPLVQRTSSKSLSEFCSKSSPRAAMDTEDYDHVRASGGDEANDEGSNVGRSDFDQPLDLSDSASALEQVKEENQMFHKHHNRKKNARRYPSEVKGPSRLLQSITGHPMDLTTANRPDADVASTNLCSGTNNRNLNAVMDLSKGQVHVSSAYSAVPNYATSLTTVPMSSASTSAATSMSATVNSNNNNGRSASPLSNNDGADYHINTSGGRSSSSNPLPKMAPSVTRTGISASLLDLVSVAHPSKRNAKAAAAAAAAHAAAISLAQAVRNREDGHPEGGGVGMVGHAGLLNSLPPNMDAASMKDYAESTMKELLGLYGFNDMAESLTKEVPLPNFLSADVLESMSNTLGLLPPPGSLLPSLLPRSLQSSATKSSESIATSLCHSPPLMQHGKLSHSSSGRIGHLNSTTTSPSPTNIAQSTSLQSSEDMYESLHSQVVGSMAKLANLPSGNVVGNPRAILPPNMNTILCLAAMQKNKQAEGSSTSPTPPLSQSQTNVSKNSAASSSRGRDSTSGMNSGIFQDQRKSSPIDYSRYVKRYVKMRLLRFSSSAECGNNSCKDLNYREHFHCLDCNSRVFIKKEEMIRHFKWHKKRDESLQHGFLRYSPMDDCSEKFPNCAHNRKQTHYHCIMEGCDKCYISTSDVQMHANYHRKDSAIIQEGFQRYRATEDCGLSMCAFSGQRTTHFHCRRSGCNFTFKNKADMEKHKTYHIKDEQLNKDGFKKFMKHEGCSFESCRFSRVCNHIHCIRPGCTYVLHSSGQLYSHKRKHERRDNEMAYRKFKLAQSMMRSIGENQGLPGSDEMKHGDSMPQPVSSPGPSVCSPSSSSGLPSSGLPSSSSFNAENAYNEVLNQSFSKYSAMLEAGGNMSLDSPLMPYGGVPGTDAFSFKELSADFLKARSDDSWRKYLSRYTANDPCKSNCDHIYKDHYHCNAENCTMVFRSKDDVREHARNHELQDQVTEAFYTTVDGGLPGCCPSDCPYQNKQRHYHCGWQNCRDIILSVDKPFRRLDHYRMHEFSHKLSFSKEPVPLNITSCSSIDGIFRRKRGRPPKNRTVEFPVTSGSSEYPQAIYTSFKLPKLNHLSSAANDGLTSPVGSMGAITPPVSKSSPSPGAHGFMSGHLSPTVVQSKVYVRDGFQVYPEGSACTSMMCSFYGRLHYHCMQPQCFYVTDRSDLVALHWKELHEIQDIDVMEGFILCERDADCHLQGCVHNKVSRHFHCTQSKCNQSFVRYGAMNQHVEMHRAELIRSINEKSYRTNDDNCLAMTSQSNHIKQSLPQVKKEQFSPPASLCPSSSSRTPSPANSLKMANVVKASGTFYPLSAFPQSFRKKEDAKCSSKADSSSDILKDINRDYSWRKREEPASSQLSAEWKILLESHVAYSAERSCGRYTCKYKNRDHVHCTYCNQAFPKLSQLQPHIQKHLIPATSSLGSARDTADDDCSDDDFSDRPADEDDDGDGLHSRHHPDSSDDSDSSSNRFPTNYRHSSPSADSTPSSQNQSYGPFITSNNSGISSGATNHLVNDLLHTFPNTAGHLQINPLANFFNSSDATNSRPPQDLSTHNQSPAMHPNGSSGHLEMNIGERSSPISTPPGSGAASSLESYGSNPSSPHLQFVNQKHFSAGAVNQLDGVMNRGGGDDFCEVKKAKVTGLRLLRDEPVPEGYIRYRFNEDCRYTHCGYREHQTHFHCMRKDCGYSFCDKTRFVQHTARHERLDTLMGGDFQQFRAQVACGRSECVYITAPGSLANKASHFHCLKCEFVCTDTNKVVAHRRQHQKLDSITAAGFEKYTAQQSCNNEGCSHNQRQTHYHCVKCQYAVLGLSQMSAHKYRHLEG